MSISVVVGAARGIGRAIADELARSDLDRPIVLADIDGDGVHAAAEELRATGVDARAIQVDIGDSEAVAQLVAATRSADRVAIAAGIFFSSPSLEAPVDAFERVLRVNTIGCFRVAQLYAEEMVMSGGGSIVGVASIAARMPRMRQAFYCASKAALRQSLRVLAMEVADRGVRINTVSPGATDTEMMRDLSTDVAVADLARGSLDSLRPRIPNGRVATAEDIARSVSFFLSPASSHVYLADLVVDGGELLGM
ncbi:MAG: SDR family NAD(P)-dependent oxidoreductase [bacterium]|nr:SDR family NAD(P)-dependent oxidoreductase [bacterium]